MTPDAAIEQMRANGDADLCTKMAATHKVQRTYLGVPDKTVDAVVVDWRAALDVPARVVLARGLWDSDVHEARIAAAKLLTQARLRPDDGAAWDAICAWMPQLDTRAIADAVCVAGQKRVVWAPDRLDTLEDWTTSDHMWTRRAALLMTLPWTRQNTPKPADLAVRDRVLGWAAGLVADKDWHIQYAIGWWLRDLAKHDAHRTGAFLDAFGADMAPFALRDVERRLDAQ